jgi:TyrR family helix-turn-helix protein
MSEVELSDVTDLPPDIARRAGHPGGVPAGWPEEFSLEQAVESTERAMLLRARARYGNQASVAKALGVNQSTVARKMKKYGIS